MSKPFSYKSGDHWVECQRCGFVHRESRMREEWTGLIVCGECWEPRHPLDFVKGLSDDQSPDGLVNPESSDTFKDEPFDTSYRTSIPEGTFILKEYTRIVSGGDTRITDDGSTRVSKN